MLTIGMRSALVHKLQQELTADGFATPATGVFDRTTQLHVIAFQRRYGLPATGAVGSAMFLKLHVVSVVRAILAAPLPQTSTSGAITANGTPSAEQASSSAAPTPSGTTMPSTTSTTSTTASTTPVGSVTSTGGISFAPGPNQQPMQPAVLHGDGLAIPPTGAPQAIRQAIAGGDLIAFNPYVYGGGHQSFNSLGYDCSGSVSFALHFAGLLRSPLDSTQFESWGQPGPGRWITLFANGGHVYMEIAGLFFDTAAQRFSNGNDRWSRVRISPAGGFVVRHPTGW
jgi:peptidoglycan hydrolase-like protein with peptidoglycan-binding domain